MPNLWDTATTVTATTFTSNTYALRPGDTLHVTVNGQELAYTALQAIYTDSIFYHRDQNGVWSIQTLTTEQAAEARERQRAADEEHARRRAEAETKAQATLRRMLNPSQLKQLNRHGTFKVTGSAGNTYRIDTKGSYSGNISLLGKSGREKARFCCHPRMSGFDLDRQSGRIPNWDAFLAQKLAIETDEIGFLQLAVVNRGRRPDVGAKHTAHLRGGARVCICKKCENKRRRDQWL